MPEIPALLREARTFVAHAEPTDAIFRTNHASNYLALAGTFPKDKARLVAGLDAVLAQPSAAQFRPEWLRGL